jgi:protein O-mannosyl-transferase
MDLNDSSIETKTTMRTDRKLFSDTSLWRWIELRSDTQLLIIICLAAFGVFANSIGNQFVYDDHFLIEVNYQLRDWRYLTTVFTESHSYDQPWINTNAVPLDYYRPFTRMLFALAFHAFGLKAEYWHLLNIILYILVVALSFFIIKYITNSRAVATISSLLFALHPVHSEAVAWVNCIVETLHAIFFLGAFLLFLKSDEEWSKVENRGSEKYTFFAGSIALMISALLSKETALCFPILIAAYRFINSDLKLLNRIFAAIKSASPYLLVVALYFLIRYLAYGGVFRITSKLPLTITLMTIPSVIVEYIEMLLAPFWLSPVNRLPLVTDPLSLNFLLPLAIVLGLTLIIFLRVSRPLALCLAIMLITMLPALSIGSFIPDLMLQNRYVFLPSLGFCGAVALCFNSLLENKRVSTLVRPLCFLLLSGILLIFGLLTIRQNRYWHDDISLWAKATEINPELEFAQCSFGWALYYGNQKQEAAKHFTESFKIRSGNSACGCLGLGVYYSDNKDYDQAIYFLERAVALGQGNLNLLVYISLAQAYISKGDNQEAINLLTNLVRERPNFIQARQLLDQLTKVDKPE